MSRIGLVVIGRNEGERLKRCLRSVVPSEKDLPVVYVDSGSTDGSVEFAASVGAHVVPLDMGIPFTAARARNAGVDRLRELAGEVDYVQFVDGDCELCPGWLDAGRHELDADPGLAAVCGQVRERFPEASIYNRLCDMEWNGPLGDVPSTGGIVLMRLSAFARAGGFDPTVPAGEEPELCARLRAAGWRIRRIAAEMTRHDVAMLRFRQWWTRQVRTGYGAMDVAERFGQQDQAVFRGIVRSARVWTLGWLAGIFIAATVGGLLFDRRTGVAAACLVALAWPAQALRIALRNRPRADRASTALAYGFFTMLSKWPQFLGQWRYARDRRRGRAARLIEHKTAGSAAP